MSATSTSPLNLNFNNTYVDLPDPFYSASTPEQVPAPYLVKFNHELAKQLGFDPDAFSPDYLAQVFSGNELLEGSQPIAQAYAGHQFGGLSPRLGDGRATLLGEIKTQSNSLLDMQLKGSGRTAFSRGGDGKATLYSVLREYLISEAMFALDIPTTRSLAVIGSGEKILRDNREVPGAILTRVASSHIRVGTFQYFAIRDDLDGIKQLADYTIERHFPHVKKLAKPYLALLTEVMDKQIYLIAQWMRVGFIHGVMNTDNMTVSGETIDYGPCAFMDIYDPGTKFSSIDTLGRYAFANQVSIGYWNLARFAETLISLVDPDPDRSLKLLTEAVETYPDKFQISYLDVMRQKFGLLDSSPDDTLIINEFFDILQEEKLDYTLAFRYLNHAAKNTKNNQLYNEKPFADLENRERFENWKTIWLDRLNMDATDPLQRSAEMNQANPVFIPRNWHVEQALTSAADSGDFSLFNAMHEALKNPYKEQANYTIFASTPQPSSTDYKTFCGT